MYIILLSGLNRSFSTLLEVLITGAVEQWTGNHSDMGSINCIFFLLFFYPTSFLDNMPVHMLLTKQGRSDSRFIL